MARYNDMVNRLADRFITSHLEAYTDTVVSIDDVLNAYRTFARSDVISDDELITKILVRFEKAKINYEHNTIINLNWIRPPKAEPKPPLDIRKMNLDSRFDLMLHYYPNYKESGITALQFADFTKNSIVGGALKVDINSISIQESTEYLNENPQIIKKCDRYFQNVDVVV